MVLTREEEATLARRARAGDMQALDDLITGTMWIVPRVVPTVVSWACPKSVSDDDLMQEGYRGLVEAARRFDPDRGVRLSTYATYWIRMRVRDAVKKELTLTARFKSLDARVSAMTELGDQAHVANCLSDMLRDERAPDPSARMEREDEREKLRDALAGLSKRQYRVVVDYYVRGDSVAMVARRNRLKRRGVALVLGQALDALRRRMGEP